MEKNRNGENSQNRQRRSIPAVDFSQQEEHSKKSREIAPPASSAPKSGNAKRRSAAPKFSNNKNIIKLSLHFLPGYNSVQFFFQEGN